MAYFGLSKNIEIDDKVDHDGDLEVNLMDANQEYLDREDAMAIIVHLKKVFAL